MHRVSPLPETPETYFRWGLPSLVLGVVTISLIAISHWVVEPRITAQYQETVLGAIQESDLSFDQYRHAELAAQRLMVRDPLQARYRRWHAELCMKIAQVAGRKQIQCQKGPDQADLEKQKVWGQLAANFQAKGVGSLRSATRLDGRDAQWARAWILREDFLKSRQRCANDDHRLDRWLGRMEEFTESSEWIDPSFVNGTISIQQAYCMSPLIEPSKRDAILKRGVDEIRTYLRKMNGNGLNALDELNALAWYAEGLASLEPEEANRTARDAILMHASKMQRLIEESSVSRRIEAIDALFRCLILVSGVDEATNSVLSRIDQIPQQDQGLLRHVVVASLFRASVSAANYPSGCFGRIAIGGMLQSALRLGPDHPELLAVLDGYFFDHRQGLAGLEHFLNATRPTSEDRYLESLKWMKKMIQNEPGNKAEFDAQKGSMRGWETQSTVGLMAYWIGATRRYRLEWNRIEPILNAMTEAQPSSGDLKLGRAILAAESGQLDRAIEELEIIRESNSNNPFVENLMRKVTQRIKEQRESDESMKEAVR
jgi:hypothetical protein